MHLEKLSVFPNLTNEWTYENHWDEVMKSSKYHPRRNQIYKWKWGIIIQSGMLDHMPKKKKIKIHQTIEWKNNSQRKHHLWNLEGAIWFCEKSHLQYCLQLWTPHMKKNRAVVQNKISCMTERKCALKEILAIRFKYGKQKKLRKGQKIQFKKCKETLEMGQTSYTSQILRLK